MSTEKRGKKALYESEQVFYDDITLPGMRYARLVRAPIAGLLVSMHPEELPENYFFCTEKDIPGEKRIRIPGGTVPVFASGTVPHPGCPVALVVGPNQQVVERLACSAAVHVNAAGIDRRAEVCAVRDITYGQEVVDDVFNQAEFSVSGTYRLALKSAVITECAGVVADWKGDRLTVYTPCEWMRFLRESLASALNIDGGEVVIKKTISTERNSNGAWQYPVLAVQAAVASRVCASPVKLSLSRAEHETYMSRLMHISVTHKTAVDAQGCIQGMIIRISANAGAAAPFAEEIVDRLALSAVGPYHPKNLRISAALYKTIVPPAGLYFSWLDYGVCFAMESQIQKIAAFTGISPVLIREKNVPPPDAESPLNQTAPRRNKASARHAAPFPFTLDLRHYHEALKTAAIHSDFERKWAVYTYNARMRAAEKHPTLSLTEPIRGIALSASYGGSVFFGSRIFSADQEVEVVKDAGGILMVNAVEPGKAIGTIWRAVMTEALKVEPEKVVFTGKADPESEPKSPALIFNNSVVMSYLLRKCCHGIRSHEGKAPYPLKVRRGITAAQRKLWNQGEFCGTPFFSTASAAVAVEVAIDPYTKRESVLGMWFAIDCGAVYALREVEKTVRRACQNMFAQLVPHQIIDPEIIHIEIIPSKNEAQQIGSLMYKLVPAAFLSALRQAQGRDL